MRNIKGIMQKYFIVCLTLGITGMLFLFVRLSVWAGSEDWFLLSQQLLFWSPSIVGFAIFTVFSTDKYYKFLYYLSYLLISRLYDTLLQVRLVSFAYPLARFSMLFISSFIAQILYDGFRDSSYKKYHPNYKEK